MLWEIFGIIATIAFALSGALVALDEDYDYFGILCLGFTTSFAGGAIRNVLIGLPVTTLWEQGALFWVALITMTILYFYPQKAIGQWNKWGNTADAIGLAAFSISGALHAKGLGLPLSAIVVAALLTGVGGGIVRDLFARRQPLVFKHELYALWAIIAGICIGTGLVEGPISTYLLFATLVILRLLSLKRGWTIPKIFRAEQSSILKNKERKVKLNT
jgi:uncharacterized membrane protein YeiH